MDALIEQDIVETAPLLDSDDDLEFDAIDVDFGDLDAEMAALETVADKKRAEAPVVVADSVVASAPPVDEKRTQRKTENGDTNVSL